MEKHSKKQEASLKLSSSYFNLTGIKPNYLTNLQFSVLDWNQAIEAIFAGTGWGSGGKEKAGKFALNILFSFLNLNHFFVLMILCRSDARCECQTLPQAGADHISFIHLSLIKWRTKSMSKPCINLALICKEVSRISSLVSSPNPRISLISC